MASFVGSYRDDRAELVLRSRSEELVAVQHLTLGEPVAVLEASEAVPDEFDWGNAESVRISVHAAEGGWGSSAQIAEVINGSAEHPTTPAGVRTSNVSTPPTSPPSTARRSSPFAVPTRRRRRHCRRRSVCASPTEN